MELFNLLETMLPMFGDTYNVSLNWIGNLIRILISGVGSVGLGIILFSLILKVIVLPFDVYQRIGMRKQNQVMKENQEQMEKLQKQYANNKDLYNQKVMELYKKSGFSVCSACLPMILSLVIFIVAINAFNAFAQYSNVQNYNEMVKAYQGELKKYTATLTEDNLSLQNGMFLVNDATGENTYIYYKVNAPEGSESKSYEENKAYIESVNAKDIQYCVNVDKVKANAALMAQVTALNPSAENIDTAIADYFVELGQNAVKTAYNSTIKKNTQFLWIKNIWSVDASYKHPVLSYKDFSSEASQEKFKVDGNKVKYKKMITYTDAYTAETYEVITEKLDAPKKAANGYFILIALSIGTILLQQVVMMRSQKEQQKFSTVDGQGASQQKMTMVIMTVMFAIFSFLYSSAFSIYMVTSNVFSMLSTIVINKGVDSMLAKREAKAASARMDNVHMSRIEAAKEAGRKAAKESQNKKENKK